MAVALPVDACVEVGLCACDCERDCEGIAIALGVAVDVSDSVGEAVMTVEPVWDTVAADETVLVDEAVEAALPDDV